MPSSSKDAMIVNGQDNIDENGHSPVSPNGDQLTLSRTFDEKIRPYIDLVDKLRNLGLDKDLDLPSIVVIGDQSTGKSSILEAISGVQLPRATGTCTRCPLEIQLKRSNSSWKARLSYTVNDQYETKNIQNPNDVGDYILQAQEQVRGTKAISKTLLTLAVESPYCPDLTMIDLPGLIRHHEDKTLTGDVRQLIQEYVSKESTIILCVILANADLETIEALSISKNVDPHRIRTIGVLTKPDQLAPGDEKRVVSILQNRREHLKLGYHIVLCRNVEENNNRKSLKQALKKEEDYFSENFKLVSPEIKGIPKLAEKLTHYLVQQIKAHLPKMREDARNKREKLIKEQEELGDGPPLNLVERKKYLMHKLEGLRSKIEVALTDGIRVPGRILLSPSNCQSIPIESEEELYNTSHMWRSLFRTFATEVDSYTNGSLNMLNGNLKVDKIQQKIVAYRGTELPKFPCFDVLKHLVEDHIKEYRSISDECLDGTRDGVSRIINYICEITLNQTPELRMFMEERCQDVLQKCHEETKKMVSREIDKELLVYTQDKTYLRTLDRVDPKMKDADQRSGSDAGSDRISPNGLFFHVNGSVDAEEDKHNATLLQSLIKVYLEVANARISDNVPTTILLSLYRQFIILFKEEVYAILASDEIIDKVKEDSDAMNRREEINNDIERLSKCMEELNTGI